jgi:hypothetical protein
MQFRFGHRAFKSKQESIVKECGMIKAISVGDQGVGHATEIEESVPVSIIAGHSGDFEAQHDADFSQCQLSGHGCKTGAI